MNLSWTDSVKDAINNNSAVRAQQARTLEDIRETIRPELDKAGQLMAMKMQALTFPGCRARAGDDAVCSRHAGVLHRAGAAPRCSVVEVGIG
ncbi:hypothetical protein [Nocardia fluminea]|uniref:hypothetical protein n=1 Tax=Nocardia fluminea TaxID=134984 RepID=UPI003437C0CF